MLFIVSEVEIPTSTASVSPAPEDGKPHVMISKASGVKCERCWRFVKAVSSDPAWAGICDRCVDALAEPVNR